MTNIVPIRTKTAGKRSSEPPIDLERVIWDPEYRVQVQERLNRRSSLPSKRQPRRRRQSA